MSGSAIFSCLLISIIICMRINATHFQGGTITYKVLNATGSTVSILLTQTYIYDYTKIGCNNSMIANQSPKLSFSGSYLESNSSVACIQYCNQSTGYTPQPVVSYCTDYSTGLNITVGQRSDRIDIVDGSYFLVAFQSLSWRKLSRPSSSTNSNTYWSILCLINLRIRADGTYNHPPAGAIISPIYIPVGIQQAITIPTIDGDNDVVRCRFASGVNECGSACPPATLPNGTVLFSNCTLLITGISVGDWYAIAIQIEDFINSTSTTPLSTVPLQFLINVQAVSSCSSPPRLTGPKSQTGQCVAIRVGQPYIIELVAENFCPLTTAIQDIATLSFPIVVKSPIVRNTTTLWSVTLTWTPTAVSVGSQVLCAVAIDSANVQSNQYCMTFTVSNDTSPTCPGETTTTTTTTTSTTITSTSSTVTTTSTTSTSTTTSTTSTTTTTTTTSATSTTSTATNQFWASSSSDRSTSNSISSQTTVTSSSRMSGSDATVTPHSGLQYSTFTSWISASQSASSVVIDSSAILVTQSNSQQNTATSVDSTTQSTMDTLLLLGSTDLLKIPTGITVDTLWSLASVDPFNMPYGQSSKTTLKSSTTDSTTASSSPNPVFPWLEVATPLAVLALILLILGICCCCCLYCCPRCCPCCLLKRRRESRSASQQAAPTNGLRGVPIDYYLIDNTFRKSNQFDEDILNTSRSLSAASSRTADDIQLNGLSSVRSERHMPHYATPLHRSSKVAPTPSLSISVSSIPSTSSAK